MSVPSHEKCTPETGSECAGRILRHLAVLTSHTRSDSSNDPDASRLPCGEKATQKTKFEWPRMVLSIFAVPTSHRRMVRSSEAEAMNLESAEKEASLTPCVCPCSTCAHFQFVVFHNRTVMSAELEASQRPSGDILTAETARLWPESVCVHRYRGTSAGGASTISLCQMAPIGMATVQTMLDALAVDVLPKSSTCGLLCHGQKVPQARVDEYMELCKRTMHVDDSTPIRTPTSGSNEAVPVAVPHCFVVASAMDTDSKYKEISPFIIANYPRPADAFVSRGTRDDPTHWPLVKAIQATTAAPSFFGPVKFEGKSYVDGAVCANNPTALAIVEAAALWPGRPIEVIVSLGVGGNPDEADDISTGMVYWVGQLTSLALSSLRVDMQVRSIVSLLKPRPAYFRFDPPTGNHALDESRPVVLQRMRAGTRKYIAECEPDFDSLAQILRPRRDSAADCDSANRSDHRVEVV